MGKIVVTQKRKFVSFFFFILVIANLILSEQIKWPIDSLVRIGNDGWIYPNKIDKKNGEYKYDFNNAIQVILAFIEAINNDEIKLLRLVTHKEFTNTSIWETKKVLRFKFEEWGVNVIRLTFEELVKMIEEQEGRMKWDTFMASQWKTDLEIYTSIWITVYDIERRSRKIEFLLIPYKNQKIWRIYAIVD